MSFVIPNPSSSVAFYIFNYPIKYYGLCLTFAIFVGIITVYFILKKRFSKIVAQDFLDNSSYLILFSLLGARLFYVVGSLDFYLQYPKEIIMVNHGGLSIYGAIFFAIIFFILYCKNKKLSFFRFCDCFAVVMPLSQAIGRWGNYFNQEAFGLPYNGFIKLFVEEYYRPFEYKNFSYFHPTFLYESLLNFILFLILFFIFLKFKNINNGVIFSVYLIFYSLIRLFVENIRLDSVLTINNIHIASFISILILIYGIINLGYILYKKERNS